LQSATRNSNVRERPVRGSFLRTGPDDLLDDLLDHLGGAGGSAASGGVAFGVVLLGGRQRLGHLAVVAVDGDGLEAELPGVEVELLDVLDVASSGMFTVLEMAPEMNGCTAAIIRTWPS
jgi:hypothetical protein